MIQCERNLKDEKNGQRHGERGEGQEGRITAGLAALVWLLVRGCAAAVCRGDRGRQDSLLSAFADVRDPTADTSPGTGEILVDIAGEDQLKQWYDQRLMGGNSIAVSAKKPGNYKTSYPGASDGQTVPAPLKSGYLRTPQKSWHLKTLTQTGVVIDNPNLLITGTKSLISVEGEGA